MSTTYAGANAMLEMLLASGTLYLGLHTLPPSRDSDGVEVSAGGYVRQGIAFDVPVAGEIVSILPTQFPAATESWGTVQSFGVYDSVSGGTMLWFDVLTDPDGNETPRTINTGDIFQAAAGNIVLSIE